jgi:type II secretory pathway component GspD/PulD (secretin)
MNRLTRAAALVAVVAAAALAAPVNDRKVRETTPEGVRRVLDQTTNLEFNNVPLQDAVTQLGEQVKLNIVLDRASAQQAGLDPNEMTVTVRLKEVKLKAGLRNMLSQYNLTYAVLGDTLLITTEEVAHTRLLRQPVDVDADNVPLAEAVKRLARTTGVNLVIDPRQAKAAQTQVTLKLDEVPLETAVRLLAELAGLKPAKMGNVLFVTTEERADRLRGEGDAVPAPAAVEHLIRGAAPMPAGPAPAPAPAVPAGPVPPAPPAPNVPPFPPPNR